MATNSKRKREEQKATGNGDIILPGALLTRKSLCLHLGWEREKFRQAKKDGLVVISYGRTQMILSDDLIRFFEERRESNGQPARPAKKKTVARRPKLRKQQNLADVVGA